MKSIFFHLILLLTHLIVLQEGNLDGALASYTKALQTSASDDKDRSIFLKNRAAVHLKKENYEAAVTDCSEGMI